MALILTPRFLFCAIKQSYFLITKCVRIGMPDLIVASRWMKNIVDELPLFQGISVHKIPFGLNLEYFSPLVSPGARQRFGIPDDSPVIFFRTVNSKFKGLEYILQALDRIRSDKPIYLITVTGVSFLKQFSGRFGIIELGFVTDQELMRDAFLAADIFLMPSIAESFGMMAVEAMACGKPLICFEETTVANISFAPDIGLSVPFCDARAFAIALQRLIDDPHERETRGRAGRKVAESHYSEIQHARCLADVYAELIKEK